MYIKKLFYKLTNKDKHFYYKMNLKKTASIKQKEKLSKGIATVSPVDTRDLYKNNIINQIQKDHKTIRSILAKSY